ncbi:hypothetical protein VSS37_04190 [Candidatus Thiothrix sp. Deng01]|uniref:Uncharacterized protein n=1 Tax=Candidatus Thiothrix phosphatis TaxID=3112415 RepID=A0ABU6CTL9_9GAMM|nr:hypothetical protein [Candidatus Thiothrix sp. Deng01]MEB4590172.1 hypothetical protein [Candidatus Thiothrix sp. Deng01]
MAVPTTVTLDAAARFAMAVDPFTFTGWTLGQDACHPNLPGQKASIQLCRFQLI